jgi:predicted SAM-dependent methyltransferase
VDRNVPHDYYSIEEIGSTFDLILLSEVLEHLSFNEGFVLLKKTRELLNDGGIIVVSTPNVFHPNKFFTTSDHRTFFAYDELAAVMELAGFRVTELHRVYNDAFHRYFLKVYLFNFLFRFLGIDYAHTVFAVGRRVDQR